MKQKLPISGKGTLKFFQQETKEWYLGSDDPRYGIHRTYSDPPPTATEV